MSKDISYTQGGVFSDVAGIIEEFEGMSTSTWSSAISN